MPAVHKLGGMDSGHAGYPPRVNIQASNNVFVEGTAVHRQGDMWMVHCCGSYCHSSVMARGSSSVYVNGRQMARLGDPVSCGSITIDGATTVFAGG